MTPVRRTALITGGASGLGFQSARALAAEGAWAVVIAGRDPEKLAKAAASLRGDTSAQVDTLDVDLAALAQVRAAAARLKAKLSAGELPPLHALVNNAGLSVPGAVTYSAEGYEESFAVNHLAHVLLTALLLPSLQALGRIVVVSSGTHDPATADGKLGRPGEPDADRLARPEAGGGKPLSGVRRYATSKLCTLLFAYELDRRLKAEGRDIAVFGFDPGFVPSTELTRRAPALVRALIRSPLARLLLDRVGTGIGDPEVSGCAMASLVTDPAYAGASGAYFQVSRRRMTRRRSSVASYDEASAARLWSASERLVGLR